MDKTVTVTKIEKGYAIANAFTHKDAIKAAVPSAKFDAATKCWIVGPRSLKKAEAAIAESIAAIEEFEADVAAKKAEAAHAAAVKQNQSAKKFAALALTIEPTESEKAESLRIISGRAKGRPGFILAGQGNQYSHLTESQKIRQAPAYTARVWAIIKEQESSEKLAEIVENLQAYEEKLAEMIAYATRGYNWETQSSIENQKYSIEQAKGEIEEKLGATFEQIEKARAIAADAKPKIGDHTHTVITVDDYDDRGNDLNVDIDILTIGINKATGIAIGCDQNGGLYFDLVRAGSARLDFAAEFGWVWANGVAGLPAHARIGISPDMMELGMRHAAKYRAECALQKRKAKAYDDLQNEGCEGFNPYSR